MIVGSSQTSATPDVYVAGVIYTQNSSGGDLPHAVYWKNGTATQLTDALSSADAIAVSGGDVYVAGVVAGSNGQDVATYWKNGVATALTDGLAQGFANSIVVANGDVYVAGGEFLPGGGGSIAKYWKNGTVVNLTDGTQPALANSIFVSGTDVYVAGFVIQTTQTAPNTTYQAEIATLWKNGVAVSLEDSVHFSSAESVFLSGGDVYVAGFAAKAAQQGDTQPVYWKNGQAVVLSTNLGDAASIFVQGQDVYAAGDIESGGTYAPVYWKNGTQTALLGSSAFQVVVSGGNAYVAGNNYPTAPILGAARNNIHAKATGTWLGATFWENGNPTPLAPQAYSSSANGIAVVTE